MHQFTGCWITDEEFYTLRPRNVFHKQLERVDLPCDEHRNCHILFRKEFELSDCVSKGEIYISADDYYKLYINGEFAGQGPAPSYHFEYNYNVIDISGFLKQGKNTIAVHTLYQGMINRVWQSGDNRHGLILDIMADGEVVLSSDETFRTKRHSGFREVGTVGYNTQFMEEYDSNSKEAGFWEADFDDGDWDFAKIHQFADYKLTKQESKALVFEKITPKTQKSEKNSLFVDFGSNYVGYLHIKATGKKGETVIIRCAQELDSEGGVRYNLRANCKYEEPWILAEGESVLDQFDYKAFRYVELILPDSCKIKEISMQVRHYPYEQKAEIKKEYGKNPELKKIWDLCVHTQKYGVQEVIQDCMEREKGFYVGDGCYTALCNMILTKDDSMVRKLIDNAFASDFITDGLVTCINCSFMQEIAEFPLMLVYLVLWHYRLSGDTEYLEKNYSKVTKLLDSYRRDYEKDGLLQNLDKWCVVEWPDNYQDNYDVDIEQGKICEEPHVSINAYYIDAVSTANKIAKVLGKAPYREEEPLVKAFLKAFYVEDKHLFRDGVNTDHISLIGNVMAFGLGLCPDDESLDNIMKMIEERKISSVSLFGAFLVLMGYVRWGKSDKIGELMLDDGAWLRMLREDATTTFEGWGKDTKWNTSLFHMTMSYGAVFLADIDRVKLFE